MTAALANRATIRKAIADGLRTQTASLSPAPQVYAYMKSGFDGLSPIVRVWAESSLRPESREQGDSSAFLITVQTWVLVDVDGGTVDQESAEDSLDAIELEIATWLEANRQTDLWHSLRYERNSDIQTFKLNAYTYVREQILVEVQAGTE